MKHKLGCNYEQFDAGVTPCASVEFVGASKPAGSLTGRNNQRAFCSLSGGGTCLDTHGIIRRKLGTLAFLTMQCERSVGYLTVRRSVSTPTAATTQRTKAKSPCAVRTRDKEHCSLNTAESSTLRICRQSISAGDAPSPSKAHVQSQRWRVTSGAQDFENVENFGHRYLNRVHSENHPAKDSETNIAAQLVKPATLKRGDKWNEGVATAPELKPDLGLVKVRFRCRVLPGSQHYHKMNYSAYLNSEHWKQTKERFKQTSMYRQGRCFICCNAAIEKHIHHLSYKRLGKERMSDLRLLCAICHAVVHDHGSCRKLRSKWYPHASRSKLWGLRYKNPVQYAREVARFFGVSGHPFVVRVCGPLEMALKEKE